MLTSFSSNFGVLDSIFCNESSIFSGGCAKEINYYDLNTSKATVVGTHTGAVKALEYHTDLNLLVSGSWDKNVSFWDIRTNTNVNTIQQSGKVYSMCLSNYSLIVATSDRQLNIYDVRNLSAPEQVRMSSLKHQTRCVRASPDHRMFVVSSIEGRVAVEYFDESPTEQAKKYAFKCHRSTVQEMQYVYPVNALAFHPSFGTFATGGCDNSVCVWDAEFKKRISMLPAYPTSIAALEFNHTGEYLAIASSYTYEQGEKEHPKDEIYIRKVTDAEVKPKPRAK